MTEFNWATETRHVVVINNRIILNDLAHIHCTLCRVLQGRVERGKEES